VEDWNWETIFTGIISLYLTTVTYWASKAIEFREKRKIRTTTPFKDIQGPWAEFGATAWAARGRMASAVTRAYKGVWGGAPSGVHRQSSGGGSGGEPPPPDS